MCLNIKGKHGEGELSRYLRSLPDRKRMLTIGLLIRKLGGELYVLDLVARMKAQQRDNLMRQVGVRN